MNRGRYLMDFRRLLMLPGFLAAFVGDWFLAVQGSPRGSAGFLAGVTAFSVAQFCWTIAQIREARSDLRVFTAIALPLVLFVTVRLFPVLDGPTAAALLVYAVLSAASLAMALATRRWAYAVGIALLLASDLAIGCRWLRMPLAGRLVGPLYLAAEFSLLASFFLRSEPRFDVGCGRAFPAAVFTAVLGALCFLAAMVVFPGGGYNPCRRMLSALGRTEVKSAVWPTSHFLFTLGMTVSALGISRFGLLLADFKATPGLWGLALNVAGLLAIAAVPENVSMTAHNAGCWLAAWGGAGMLLAWSRANRGRIRVCVWSVLLIGTCVLLGTGLALHVGGVVAFSPWVPTAQKVLILAYASWLFYVAYPRNCQDGCLVMPENGSAGIASDLV